MKYVLGDLSFKTKKEIKTHYQTMLNRYEHNDDVSWQDSIELIELLKWHRGIQQKRGVGIEKIKVERWPWEEHGMWRSKCFWIVRKDGTKVDFSYDHCINNIKPTLKKELINEQH